MKDEPHSGRPITEKSDEIMIKVEREREHCGDCQGTRHRPQNSFNHLHKARYKKKLDVWVPHELSVRNMTELTFVIRY